MTKSAVAIGALIGAVAGAAAGALIEKLWATEPMDADEFARRLAKLESEIEELEQLQRERRRKAESAAAERRAQAGVAGMRGKGLERPNLPA